MKISIFGSGYVGLTTGACLANLGHEVLCVDISVERIKMLQEGKIPFYEPGLAPLVKSNVEKGRLKFSCDAIQAVEFSEVIFNCVGTPSNDDGSAKLDYVYNVANTIAENMNSYKVIVVKSTVPPGTARKVAQIIGQNNQDFDVVSNPEFLREGNAIRAFNYPDKIVIGAITDKAYSVMRKVYSGRLRMYLPIVETNWETAEVIKYANNTFLSTKISFINEMANICDHLNADVKTVSMALGMDYRIAPRFLSPGVGYGGSCFPKDVRALVSCAKKSGYHAKLFEEVDALNERQKLRIVEKIKYVYGDDLSEKTFAILGLSFKPKTSDMREAPSTYIIPELIKLGAKIRVHDPVAMEEAKPMLNSSVIYCNNLDDTITNSHAIVLITEWDEFRNLDLSKLKLKMQDAKFFDGRNVYEPELVKEEGFEYFGMGRK
jgi:UDPglucose 6-dehydrogenase